MHHFSLRLVRRLLLFGIAIISHKLVAEKAFPFVSVASFRSLPLKRDMRAWWDEAVGSEKRSERVVKSGYTGGDMDRMRKKEVGITWKKPNATNKQRKKEMQKVCIDGRKTQINHGQKAWTNHTNSMSTSAVTLHSHSYRRVQFRWLGTHIYKHAHIE